MVDDGCERRSPDGEASGLPAARYRRARPADKHAPVPPAGSVIAGKYRVVRVLGAGGMGVVVEAIHLALGQRVAVKLVGGVDRSPRALARFLNEARIAAQLPGDHIGRAIDVGQTEAG